MSECEKVPNGHVLILPGVENVPWTFWGVLRGLRDGGVAHRISICNWGLRVFGTFPNLTRYRRNRRKAAVIATEVLRLSEREPDARITLIGYSGGGGMALFLAEALPEDFKFERIILVAPAVSPTYELAPALARSRRGVLSYYSSRDSFFLGWGTRTFGTMDRAFINAAGRYGFRDRDGELRADEKLLQVEWRPEWRGLGHRGGHVGWLARGWAREVLAKEVMGTE